MNIILAIETSCDETSIAILKDDNLLSLVTNTQIDTFKEYGGVVPELSSRLHINNLLYVYEKALEDAEIRSKEIDYIAVTVGPGLKGSLLMGVNFAKTLSLILNIPIIEINHLQAHIYALSLTNEIEFPHLSLIVSGGHTELILLEKPLQFKRLGRTLDDAVGESYDKVARLLQLPYPGGPKIDKLAKQGKDTYDLPYPKDDNTLDFSFSGIKSASFNLINQHKMKNKNIKKADFAASFQNRVLKVLENKFDIAIEKYSPKQLSVVGGVSANSKLRKRFLEKYNNILIPDSIYSTDNAAMVGALANVKLTKGEIHTGEIEIDANPNLVITD